MTRVNLQTNPSFRAGLANAVGVNGATLAITSDYAFYGSDALEVTKSDDNNSGYSSTVPIAVVAGLPYAVSAYVRLPVTLPAEESATLSIHVQWRDVANTVISSNSSGELELVDDTTWARLSGVWTAPVGAVTAYVLITQITGGTDGAVFILDAILFEQASYVGGYLDNLTQAQENEIVNKALSRPVPQIINGLRLNADVTINELILNTIDEDGTIWICTGIVGWWSHSTPESPDIPRGVDDGSYDVSGRYQARILTLTGSFFPPNNEDALSASRDKLISATNLVREGGWLRTNENPTKAAFVRLSGLPQIETINNRGRTDFSIGLKAGDPVKYEWNDSDPYGFKHVVITGADQYGIAENPGTATVTGTFRITGPIGAGSSIYNALNDETMTLTESLRGAGVVGHIESAAVTNSVATITTTNDHHLIEGDIIVISGAGLPYDSINTTYTVTAASQSYPFTVNFDIASDDLEDAPTDGQVQLARNDVLEINTYDKSITFNGVATGNRGKLETLTEWLTLAPGNNLIEFADDIDAIEINKKQLFSNSVTLTANDVTYLSPGEDVVVSLPEIAELSKKSLTSNVVTLTTIDNHGFSIGDKIDVASTEIAIVDSKVATTTDATLHTTVPSGVTAGDSITVSLPAAANPITKSLTSNVATITTQYPHGYSVGDTVLVALPSVATVANKALTSNQVTLTTAAAHGFAINDSITVALGTAANVITKERSGAQAVITTDSAHGFSIGDSVIVALPETATLTNSRSIGAAAGGYLVTLNTSGAHNFSLGDRVNISIGVTATATVTNRASSTTTRTLTVGSHGFSIGEKVTVSGINANYDGTFYISGVTGTTFSYVGTSSLAESTTASAGSVTNVTIQSYYNGTGKVVETVPTSTSFTYLAYDQEVATTSTATGTSPTVLNTTNQAFNGTKTLISSSGSVFAYNL